MDRSSSSRGLDLFKPSVPVGLGLGDVLPGLSDSLVGIPQFGYKPLTLATNLLKLLLLDRQLGGCPGGDLALQAVDLGLGLVRPAGAADVTRPRPPRGRRPRRSRRSRGVGPPSGKSCGRRRPGAAGMVFPSSRTPRCVPPRHHAARPELQPAGTGGERARGRSASAQSASRRGWPTWMS